MGIKKVEKKSVSTCGELQKDLELAGRSFSKKQQVWRMKEKHVHLKFAFGQTWEKWENIVWSDEQVGASWCGAVLYWQTSYNWRKDEGRINQKTYRDIWLIKITYQDDEDETRVKRFSKTMIPNTPAKKLSQFQRKEIELLGRPGQSLEELKVRVHRRRPQNFQDFSTFSPLSFHIIAQKLTYGHLCGFNRLLLRK